MPRKFRESRYRLEATIPLELLVKVEEYAKIAKMPTSRAVESLLRAGLEYSYDKAEQASVERDLQTIKEIERLKESKIAAIKKW